MQQSSLSNTKTLLMSDNATFPIGGLKGTPISECDDLEYLQWYDKSIKSTPGVRRAVFERIQELTKK